LRANRAQVSRNQILARELGGIMPVVALCGGAQTPSFYGGSDSLRMISSYSIAEGFRGYPQVVEMRVVRASSGGLQLVASEQPYSPGSTGSFCGASGAEFAFGSPAPIVLADDLASCSFSYRPPRNPFGTQESDWAPEWTKGMTLPAAIKVEMKPKQSPGGGLPAMTVTVPVRVDRNLYQGYTD